MITDEEIEQLPAEPHLAFTEFERICRERTNARIDEAAATKDWPSFDIYHFEYINKVLAAAREFEIDALRDWEVPKVDSNIDHAFRQFTADVDHFTT